MKSKKISPRMIVWIATLVILLLGIIFTLRIAKNFDNPEGPVYIMATELDGLYGYATLGIKIMTASVPVTASLLIICFMWIIFNIISRIKFRRAIRKRFESTL